MVLRIEEFYTFMRKRESIRLKKEAGEPWPWTADPILRKYKFTNVKRAHDKTSCLLREEFYTPHSKDAPEIILLNCAIARYFGTIEFMRAVGWQTKLDANFLKQMAKERLANRERVFTGAYIITNNGITGPKQDVVVDVFLSDLWLNSHHVVQAAQLNWHLRDAASALMKVRGFGGTGFMAKEVLMDTRYTNFWPAGGAPFDKNDWTLVGPGSKRGAKRLGGKGETLETLCAVFAARSGHWPTEFVGLELADIQFQACEFDKYERVRLGEGRPRSLYHHI